jgi:hypothetical protein
VRWLPVLLVGLLLPSLAAAEPGGLPEATLFLHPTGAGSYRINTQPPRETYLEPRPAAPAPNCGANVGMPQQAADYVGRSEQVLLREANGGGVGYMDEARLQGDVNASADGLALHWVMATQFSSLPGVDAPAAAAKVVVEASLRSITADREGVGAVVLAAGRSGDLTLARQSSVGVAWTVVDGLDVYEVDVPMAWGGPPVFPRDGYTLLVTVRADLPSDACGGASPPGVVAYADPFRTPFLRARVDAPPRVRGLELSPGEDGRVLTAAVTGGWGSSDVDAANATLDLRGPDGQARPVARVALQQAWHSHGHSFDPLLFAWVWNATGAPAGTYTATLTVPNLQHTATGAASLQFQVAPARPAPAGGLLVAFAALGLALLRRRS